MNKSNLVTVIIVVASAVIPYLIAGHRSNASASRFIAVIAIFVLSTKRMRRSTAAIRARLALTTSSS